MNTRTFSEALEARIGARCAFGEARSTNTNNAWGFGGWTGTVLPFLIDGRMFEFRTGQAYFRHLGAKPVNTVCELNGEVGGVIKRWPVKEFLSESLTIA